MSGTVWETLDTTGYRWDSSTNIVTDRLGTRYNLTSGLIEDANGNTMTSGSSGWTDSLGRSIPPPPSEQYGTVTGVTTTDFSGCSGSQATYKAYTWTIPGYTGNEVYKFCYAQFPVSFSITGSQAGTYSGTPMFLQSLVLPNDQTWTFEYDAKGNLSSVSLPTGGTISYTWTDARICGDPSYPRFYFRGVTTRALDADDGQGSHIWTYSSGAYSLSGASLTSITTDVTDPLGNLSEHYFTALGPCTFYETSDWEYQGSGTLLRETDTTYQTSTDTNYAATTPLHVNSVEPSEIDTILYSGSVQFRKKLTKTYDAGFTYAGDTGPGTAGYGQLITESEYDIAKNAFGPLLRTTTRAYLATTGSTYLTDNILDALTSLQTKNASGTQVVYTTYAYDEFTADSGGITTQHTTSPYGTYRGNQTSIHRWLNPGGTYLVTNSHFFDTGMVETIYDPKLNATNYLYSTTYAGGYLTTIKNALNQSTTNLYDFNTGLLMTTTDPNGQPTNYTYDTLWRIATAAYPDGGLDTVTRQELTFPVSATLTRKITSSQNSIATSVFDGLGREIHKEISSDPQGTDYTDTTYDADGRLATVTNPYRTTSDSSYGVTSYQYDGLGRTILVIPPDGSATSDNVQTQYCGPTTMVTDEAGHWRRSTTDGLGRLIEVDEPNSASATVSVCPGTGEPIWVTTYSYDALDDLLGVVQGGSHSRTFVYDSLKRLTTSTNPEAGVVSYTYDADSNVLTKQDARGVTITYGYEALNRLQTRTYSNGDPTVTYTYDQATCVVITPCYNVGHRTSMVDSGGSEVWSYDKVGREAGEQRTTNAIAKTTSYTYNFDGSLATLTYPSGRKITYAVNGVSEPTTASDVANGITYASNGDYNPAGSPAAVSYGSAYNTTVIYNSRLQPCWLYTTATPNSPLPIGSQCTATQATGTMLDMQYNFSLGAADNGNVVGIANRRDTTRSQSFTYDQVNRVVTAQTPAPCGSNCWSQAFTYDQWANLTTVTATGTAPAQTISVGTNNRISTTGFNFDAAGNETSDVTSTYVWNAESEMKTGGGVNYTYDGDGDRVQKSNGKLYWFGVGTQILDESDAAGNITDEYIYFGGKRIAHRLVSTNAIYYYAEDVLGSSRALGTSAGALCYDADFYPFGGEHDFTNSCPQNYKFTGKERDAETGNDDYDARYYSSAYGRFLSADWSAVPAPVPYANLTNPQTLNLYAMVNDNPETFADLDGHVNPSPDDPRRGPCADSGTTVCGQQQQQQSAQSSTAAQAQAQNQSQQAQSQTAGQVVFNQVKKEFPQLSLSDKNYKDLGAHNGHENISVSGTAGKDQLAQVQKTLDQNKGAFGPGSRIDIKIDGKSFSLHVEFFQSNGSGDTRNIQFQSHIDRGNPNRDLLGIGTHVFVDGFRGAVFHPNDPGLDPQ
ncbi:MAG: RHS repeat-associated core domain-containing protein [Candidatus Acidiferrales bacterium]